jgi:N-acetylmuramoyl-L-alanine amidase
MPFYTRLAMLFAGGVIAALLASTLQAATVKGLRLWRAPDNTRLVLDLSGPVEHKLLSLPSEKGHVQRLVVTLNADISIDMKKIPIANTPIAALRQESVGGKSSLIIDLDAMVTPKSFLLPANEQYGDRLVLDLFDDDKKVEQKIVRPASNGLRDVIIAIDAGHGGEDPGAKGHGGLYEKVVTLAIAKELVKRINDTPGYSAFLTRSGDYYVSLRGRTQIARKKSADLFVSVHADAFNDNNAQGAGVFALSQRGATSEAARWLAQKENDADLVGGVSFSDKDPMLQGVLLDLSLTATVATSLDMGDKVIGQMKKITKLHRGHVEQAGFVVLKNPDIPSLLVETGFITNAKEAANLAKPEFRSQMATAIFTGIDSYFRNKPPMDTALAAARGGKVSRTVDRVSDVSSMDAAIAEDELAVVEQVKVSRDSSAEKKSVEEKDAIEKLLAEKAVVRQQSANSKVSADKAVVDEKQATTKVRQHVVAKGETLSGIAQRYKVSMIDIKNQNKMTDQHVRIGQKLLIPQEKCLKKNENYCGSY